MTSKERMLAVMQGKPVDKVPVHHLQFSGHAANVILGREGYVGGAYLQWKAMHALWNGPQAHHEFLACCERDALAIAQACGHDLLRLHYWGWNIKPSRKIDDCNFLFGDPDKEWYVMTYDPQIELLTRRDGIGATQLPASHGQVVQGEPEEEDLQRQAQKEEELADSYQPPAGVDERLKGYYQRYPDYMLKLGGETVFVEMNSVPDMLAIAYWPQLVARINVAKARRIAKDIPRLARSGMEVNFSGWDFCTKDGPIISPTAFRHVLTPALKIIVDAAHANSMRYFYSGDGNFWPVTEDFFDIAGIDGYYETDRSAGMELRPLRERFPRTTFIGNIRVQVLHRGTKDDVIREVMSCLEVAHELGGVVVGASNMIMPGTPPENIHTMLDLIEKNR
jgi:hypothetical protein